ncbi:serine acetyltransferase [Actinomyces sp. 594]|uniref:serine acetyltransferase n=1 Tax=Actinomyces sp. 594 TaxID=2057793 RepID=UPI001C56F415|nr:serine acetyltransferase [Actinomyces sp. 594]MBW3068058.1 serine acetyltransferase [Actinomyces sp. 594]
MTATAQQLFRSDLFRYFGRTDAPLTARLGERKVLSYLWAFRHAQSTSSPPLQKAYRAALSHLSATTFIQIPWSTKIGPGFYIGHRGRIIINPATVIGSNCNIATGVTIGAIPSGRRAGTPTIGDRVWIGTNAVIVGGITIGDDVLIAPGALVNIDVPSGATVIGNPGVIKEGRPCPPEYMQNLWMG